MTVRITTAQTFNAGVANLQSRQRELADTQQQLTSGKRVQRASDDPSAAARAERALVTISRSEADMRAMEASRNALTLTERALADGGELLQQARELVVSAGNATYSPGERRALGLQLGGIREQLLSIANRTDEAGGYLFFPEWRGSDPPMDGAAPPTYRGTPSAMQAERQTAGREALPLNVDGMAAWRIDAGSGESALLKGLDDTIAALNSTAVPPPSATAIAAAGIQDVDVSLTTLQNLRARVGELMNRADMIEGRIADAKLHGQSERSNAEDLDMVEAISQFQNRQSSYDAALKTYSMVQRMSLFQYLSAS